MPTAKTAGRFEEVAARTYEVWRETQRLASHDASKVSATAMFRQALEFGRSSPERIAALRRALDGDGRTDSFPRARAFVRAAVRWLAEGHTTGVPRESYRLNYLSTPSGVLEQARPELAILGGANDYEAFALAIQIAAEKHPTAFGAVDDLEAHKMHVAEVTHRWEEMKAALPAAVTAQDMTISDVDAHGRALVALRLGAIPLTKTWPEELMGFLDADPEARRAVGVRERDHAKG